MNRLYFSDNLKWLADRKVCQSGSDFPDASVDLVYLDPPFNSNADYNVPFREPSGAVSQAQFHAFTDTSALRHQQRRAAATARLERIVAINVWPPLISIERYRFLLRSRRSIC